MRRCQLSCGRSQLRATAAILLRLGKQEQVQMDMTGEERIAASREAVWAALNDVEVLRQCIPGCESLEKQSDTDMTAKVKLQIGPVRAAFAGKVRLSDLDPPNGYRISGEGQGGVAGYAKGGAVVRLIEDGVAHASQIRGQGRRRRQACAARRPIDRTPPPRSSRASSSRNSAPSSARHPPALPLPPRRRDGFADFGGGCSAARPRPPPDRLRRLSRQPSRPRQPSSSAGCRRAGRR